jgi:hypothetical protein
MIRQGDLYPQIIARKHSGKGVKTDSGDRKRRDSTKSLRHTSASVTQGSHKKKTCLFYVKD